MERKRVTVAVLDKIIQADLIGIFLREHGVDAKIVTKHAVQVHPDHEPRVRELQHQFKGWLDARNTKGKTS